MKRIVRTLLSFMLVLCMVFSTCMPATAWAMGDGIEKDEIVNTVIVEPESEPKVEPEEETESAVVSNPPIEEGGNDGVVGAGAIDGSDTGIAAGLPTGIASLGEGITPYSFDGSISGRVTNGSGNPLADVWVAAWEVGGWGGTIVSTDSNGEYVIDGLAEGDYIVEFHGLDDYAGQFYSNKTKWEDAELVSVASGIPINNINAVLASAGKISGRVTNEAGEGLEGVSINSIDANDLGGGSTGGTSTDADGYYTLGSLPAGSYLVSFTDYWPGEYAQEYYNNKANLWEADSIAVTAGITTSNINAELALAGKISGQVTDEAGVGLEGICVYSSDADSGENYGFALTDADGYYTLVGLPEGSYVVCFEPNWSGEYAGEYYNNARNREDAELVTVIAGQTTLNIDAVLAKAGKISGRVTNEAGEGLEGIYVHTFDQENWFGNGAITDADGYYTIGGLAAGEYKVEFYDETGDYIGEYYNDARNFEDAEFVVVATGEAIENINAVLATAGKISGRVTNAAGVGLEDIGVSILQESEYGVDHFGWGSTDGDGYYTVAGLPEGSYIVQFTDHWNGEYATQYYNNTENIEDAELVMVVAGEMTADIDAVLGVAGKISGRVTNSAGEGIEGVRVTAIPAGAFTMALLASNSAVTDTDGYYTITGLSEGEYILEFVDEAGEYATAYYGDPVTVTSSETTPNIDIVLTEAGKISGRVTNSAGEGIEGIWVWIHRTTEYGYESVTGDYTDADGYYTIGGLTVGSYKVEFYDGTGEYVGEYYNDARNFEDAEFVVVVAGETTEGIDAILATAGKISGRVTNKAGEGLEGIWVWIHRATEYGYESVTGDYTDADGYYTIGGLTVGSYKVEFYDETGEYAGQFYNNVTDIEDAELVPVAEGEITPDINAAMIVFDDELNEEGKKPPGGELKDTSTSKESTSTRLGKLGDTSNLTVLVLLIAAAVAASTLVVKKKEGVAEEV